MYGLLTEEMLLESSTVQLWLEKGRQQGLEEARQLILKEERQQVRLLVHQLLELKFAVVPEWATAKLDTATRDQLYAWASKILSAQTVEEILE